MKQCRSCRLDHSPTPSAIKPVLNPTICLVFTDFFHQGIADEFQDTIWYKSSALMVMSAISLTLSLHHHQWSSDILSGSAGESLIPSPIMMTFLRQPFLFPQMLSSVTLPNNIHLHRRALQSRIAVRSVSCHPLTILTVPLFLSEVMTTSASSRNGSSMQITAANLFSIAR